VSEQTIQIVQSLYAAFANGHIKTIIKASSADIVWETVGRRSDSPILGRWTGLEGIAEFFQALEETEQGESFSPKDFHATGDKVFVEGHLASTLKASGRRVDTDWLHVFTIRDGLLIGFRAFYDTAQLVIDA
jgi:ketosteroid isomerase-like protein